MLAEWQKTILRRWALRRDIPDTVRTAAYLAYRKQVERAKHGFEKQRHTIFEASRQIGKTAMCAQITERDFGWLSDLFPESRALLSETLSRSPNGYVLIDLASGPDIAILPEPEPDPEPDTDPNVFFARIEGPNNFSPCLEREVEKETLHRWTSRLFNNEMIGLVDYYASFESFTYKVPAIGSFEMRTRAKEYLEEICKTVEPPDDDKRFVVVSSKNSPGNSTFEFGSYDVQEIVTKHPSVGKVSRQGATVFIRVASDEEYKPYVSWLTDWQARNKGRAP